MGARITLVLALHVQRAKKGHGRGVQEAQRCRSTCIRLAAKKQDALINPGQSKAIPRLRLGIEDQLRPLAPAGETPSKLAFPV